MNAENSRLDPPDSAIMAGYNMMKAREGALKPGGYYAEYLAMAIDCVHTAEKDIKAMGVPLFVFEKSDGLVDLFAARRKLKHATDRDEYYEGAHLIGRAHMKFARILKRRGFRTITDEDFAELGAGGGR